MKDVVLDTNCLIMAVSAKKIYNKAWSSFIRGDYTLCVSNEILEEYLEVLTRNISAHVAEAIVSAILTRKNVRMLDPHFRFQLIKTDEDDNKFVDCAISANATYIVSEDRHFDVLRQIKFPVVTVIGIDEFLSQLPEI